MSVNILCIATKAIKQFKFDFSEMSLVKGFVISFDKNDLNDKIADTLSKKGNSDINMFSVLLRSEGSTEL